MSHPHQRADPRSRFETAWKIAAGWVLERRRRRLAAPSAPAGRDRPPRQGALRPRLPAEHGEAVRAPMARCRRRGGQSTPGRAWRSFARTCRRQRLPCAVGRTVPRPGRHGCARAQPTYYGRLEVKGATPPRRRTLHEEPWYTRMSAVELAYEGAHRSPCNPRGLVMGHPARGPPLDTRSSDGVRRARLRRAKERCRPSPPGALDRSPCPLTPSCIHVVCRVLQWQVRIRTFVTEICIRTTIASDPPIDDQHHHDRPTDPSTAASEGRSPVRFVHQGE